MELENPLLILQDSAVNKLELFGLLEPNGPPDGFWTLAPLPFELIFPEAKLQDGKVPIAYNSIAFLRYLGFEAPIAEEMFNELGNAIPLTRITMTAIAKNYTAFKLSRSPNRDAMLGSYGGDLALTDMGLSEFVREQINDLWRRAQVEPSTMDRYLTDENGLTFAGLTLIDFVLELLDQRMTNVHMLDRQVNRTL